MFTTQVKENSEMEGQTDGWTERWTYGQTDRKMVGQTDIQRDEWTHGRTDRQTDVQIEKTSRHINQIYY